MQLDQLCETCHTPMQLVRHEGKYQDHEGEKDRYAIYRCDQCDIEMRFDIAKNRWVKA